MSTRVTTIALFAGALGVALLALGFLRSGDSPNAEPMASSDVREPAGAREPSGVRGARGQPFGLHREQGELSEVRGKPTQRSEAREERAQSLGTRGEGAELSDVREQRAAERGLGDAESGPPQSSQTPLAGARGAASVEQGAANNSQRSDSQRSSTADPADAEKVFATEKVDASWAPGMEATLYEQIGEIAGANVVTVNTECRMTLCRLEVTQHVPEQAGRSADESPAMYEMYETLFARLGFESRSVTSTSDGKGVVTSVVYLPRGDSDSADPSPGTQEPPSRER